MPSDTAVVIIGKFGLYPNELNSFLTHKFNMYSIYDEDQSTRFNTTTKTALVNKDTISGKTNASTNNNNGSGKQQYQDNKNSASANGSANGSGLGAIKGIGESKEKAKEKEKVNSKNNTS
eukprot:CAMPEP_0116919596 /NCGR_PEP_ID=MMETSP0467-20121206/20488_1 /TAXON_ID=283647 /ORGANISM="Mesodinium pulex, Strain SPMC105" /LENGTH=119 /DNA_ID=CAMNT_0004597221 /DNA_START=543 /DNA_END=905 /DNA_ORIENTATION=+